MNDGTLYSIWRRPTMIYQQIRRHPFRFLLYLTLSLACVPYGIAQRTPEQQETLDEAFLTAVQRRDWAKIQQLLDSGANINARARTNRNYALQYAVFWPDANLVKFLLDKGADINLTDDGDDTALMEAANNNDPQNKVIVKLLLERGANVHASGNRALLNAAKEGGPEIVQLLLQKGADPNARNIVKYAGDSAADTALMYAVQGNFVKAVQLLLAAGADVRAVNESGQTVLMKAARVDAGNDVKTHVAMLELLLKRGVDVNARDKEGKTALMHAAYEWFTEAGGVFSHAEILRVLLAHGAEVNAQNRQGDTALMTAIQHCRITPAKAGNLEVVKILLEKGAQVNLQNRDGRTAMTYAKALPVGDADADQIRSSIIALLKKAGAKE